MLRFAHQRSNFTQLVLALGKKRKIIMESLPAPYKVRPAFAVFLNRLFWVAFKPFGTNKQIETKSTRL